MLPSKDVVRVVRNLPQRGLATASDLAAFRLSMIAPVTKTVNHWRTHVSMCTIAREIMQMCQLIQKCVFVYGKVGKYEFNSDYCLCDFSVFVEC